MKNIKNIVNSTHFLNFDFFDKITLERIFMKVIITNNDIKNLNKYMLLHSSQAKKQKMMSIYGIAFEFIVGGLILDGVFKMVPYCSIASLIMAILWLIFYPKFYNKLLQKHLKQCEETQNSSIEMNFCLNENDFSFSPQSTPEPSEIFFLKEIKKLAKSDENYFIALNNHIHIVLPKNEQTQNEINKISQKIKKEISAVVLN